MNYSYKVSKESKFYIISIIGFGLALFWLLFNAAFQSGYTVCIFKNVTGIPCPSCGSTRSLISILNGDFGGALRYNPIGYLLFIIGVIGPIWIFGDIVFKRKTFFEAMRKISARLKNPYLFGILIFLITLNWIWNLNKHYAFI